MILSRFAWLIVTQTQHKTFCVCVCVQILKASYFKTVQAGWRIWPAAQLLNQSVKHKRQIDSLKLIHQLLLYSLQVVPLHLRTVSMDVVSFFWDMYLTLAISGTPPTNNMRGVSSGDSGGRSSNSSASSAAAQVTNCQSDEQRDAQYHSDLI